MWALLRYVLKGNKGADESQALRTCQLYLSGWQAQKQRPQSLCDLNSESHCYEKACRLPPDPRLVRPVTWNHKQKFHLNVNLYVFVFMYIIGFLVFNLNVLFYFMYIVGYMFMYR